MILLQKPGLQGCDTVLLGERILTFQRDIVPSSPWVKTSKNTLKMNTLCSFNVRSHSTTQYHITEDLAPQKKHCKNPMCSSSFTLTLPTPLCGGLHGFHKNCLNPSKHSPNCTHWRIPKNHLHIRFERHLHDQKSVPGFTDDIQNMPPSPASSFLECHVTYQTQPKFPLHSQPLFSL
jgi:hypothetical protein